MLPVIDAGSHSYCQSFILAVIHTGVSARVTEYWRHNTGVRASEDIRVETYRDIRVEAYVYTCRDIRVYV